MHFNSSSNIVRRLESLRNAGLCKSQYVSCRTKGYYSVLEINPDADSKEIKDSFYNLSKKHHPDLNKDNDASIEKFREILEAYETLINPELRKLYDQKHGIGVSPGPGRESGSLHRPPGRKFDGRMGEFRNGKFVDYEATPQMRNIEYDLSPERMEKVWARYKSRWDRVDEINRLRDLEKKKEEFRRKVDEKRARMHQMTEEEKEDFLFKLRQLRPDAVSYTSDNEQEDKSAFNKEQDDESVKAKKKRMEREQGNTEDLKKEMRRRRAEEREKANEARRKERLQFNEMVYGKEKWEAMEAEADNFIRRHPRPYQRKEDDFEREDPMYYKMNRSNPADAASYMRKSWEQSRETYERMKQDRDRREDNPKMTSVKYGVQGRKKGWSAGEWAFIATFTLASLLLYIELKN